MESPEPPEAATTDRRGARAWVCSTILEGCCAGHRALNACRSLLLESMRSSPAVADASSGHALTRGDQGRVPLSVWNATLLFVVLTAVMTWPQMWHPLSVPDHSDPYFSMWRLAWIAHQLPRDPVHLFDGNIFYPLRHTLAFSDGVLLQGVAGAPLVWFGVPVVLVYNLHILATFVLCGVGMFLLVRDVAGSSSAGLISGIIFAFASYRFDHYIHLELLSSQWMPFALWMLHRTLQSGRLTDGLWTGVFGSVQSLSCVYFAVFFATILAVLAPALMVTRQAAARRRATVALGAGALLAAAVMTPYMMQYRAAREVVGERGSGEQALYAAGPKHYIASMPDSLLYGRLTGSVGLPEKRLFPGFAAMLLVAVALWPPVDRQRIAYAVAAAVAVDISFGHRGILGAGLQAHTEVYRGLRVIARIGALVLMLISILAGFGVARIVVRVRRSGWAIPAVIALGLIVVLESLVRPMYLERVETRPGGVYRWLLAQPSGVVAEFPMPISGNKPIDPGLYESRFAYNSTFHWRPLVNGYSGFWPSSYVELLRAAKDFPSDDALEALSAKGVEYLILHERFYGPEGYRRATRALDSRQDLTGFGPFGEGSFEVRAYRLPARYSRTGAGGR
jgi:hypothetical protein